METPPSRAVCPVDLLGREADAYVQGFGLKAFAPVSLQVSNSRLGPASPQVRLVPPAGFRSSTCHGRILVAAIFGAMTADTDSRLTARETECLLLVLELHTNDAIARELDLSTNTVRNHIASARNKLGGLGRYDAARKLAASRPASSASQTRSDDPKPHSPDIEFREPSTAFQHDPTVFRAAFEPAHSERVRPRSRVLLILAAAVLIALLIIATPPMAASFKSLAAQVEPFFRGLGAPH